MVPRLGLGFGLGLTRSRLNVGTEMVVKGHCALYDEPYVLYTPHGGHP